MIIKSEQFSKLLHELECCGEDEKKQKMEEMKRVMEELDYGEFKSVFTKELFDKIHQMIEKKKLSMENALKLLKQMGYCKALKYFSSRSFGESSLGKRFEKMMIDENEKKEEKDVNHLIDLCECYLLLEGLFSSKYHSIYMPFLLKVASKKEESKEVQKEVEMALLALVNTFRHSIKKELYLSEIVEIIKRHQEFNNLTRLACSSAWVFLINRVYSDKSLEKVIVDELHFARDATRELEHLSKCVDWKREKEERKGKETKEELIIFGWICTITCYLSWCKLRNEELTGLIVGIADILFAAKDNYQKISNVCIDLFKVALRKEAVKAEGLLSCGVVDAVLEGIQQPTLNDYFAFDGLRILKKISKSLKGKKRDEIEEVKGKEAKKKVFKKLEEEGYEDTITSFHKIFGFLNIRFWQTDLSLNISDYLVNV
ncbi:uncharacterized protein MONOS_5292 [Monocercomonoides exilis]|uniref:uncharacterized protein n=1 Tax=Monocercomonoides exilis TaxID=2049356 RepID=UPI003559F04F|nr:hypothetical protein MONOS_5292 [Monocercomonoides exilis]|eukprot:MONOS_5292.1-p1 / transcript=MONOS_5292.1 / gene=MONOS_5292 / organism=Monocercomonoides_exilis_PA203 / gene_product=unspecified product / transcript_product=unspecified product / location=Mono_scaffold00152:67617-69031(+) / protein_length=429 / sequence_SO=supercontig / SO=protein_coding / is_pseudo=false